MTYASGLPKLLLPFSVYETKAVIIAMIITAVVSISVTIFCFQTKVRVWARRRVGGRAGGASLATPPPFLYINLALQAWHFSRPARAQNPLHQGFPLETLIPFPFYWHLQNCSLHLSFECHGYPHAF